MKEQAASITLAKIQELYTLIPPLKAELDLERGKTKQSKAEVRYVFKNGSKIDILAARQSSRGQRRTSGLIEEAVLVDGDVLNEVIIPTTNVDRLLADGTRHPEELCNKSQIYITSAGDKTCFAYKRLIELLVMSIVDPDQAMILGGTYHIPVAEGLLNQEFVNQLKMTATFSEEGFNREYMSVWAGQAEGVFFEEASIDKNRKLKKPEFQYPIVSKKGKTKGKGEDFFYFMGVDVGRLDCQTEVCILKCYRNNSIVMQEKNLPLTKALVNIFTFDSEHFEDQAIHIKQLYRDFRCKGCCIDANGMGRKSYAHLKLFELRGSLI